MTSSNKFFVCSAARRSFADDDELTTISTPSPNMRRKLVVWRASRSHSIRFTFMLLPMLCTGKRNKTPKVLGVFYRGERVVNVQAAARLKSGTYAPS